MLASKAVCACSHYVCDCADSACKDNFLIKTGLVPSLAVLERQIVRRLTVNLKDFFWLRMNTIRF